MAKDLTFQIVCNRNPIASGGFGVIYRGVWVNDLGVEISVVLKVVRGPPRRVERQIKLGAKIDDKHVLELLGFSDGFGSTRSLVYPFCENGNAIEYLKIHRDANRLAIVIDIAQGLKHLHLRSIIHGDIKGLNILIRSDGTAALCDFDRSRVIDEPGYTTSFAGSWRYQAPEYSMLIDGENDEVEQVGPVRVTEEGDMYAFGMTSLELLSGDIPFNDISIHKVIWAACSGRRPKRNKYNLPIAKDALWELFEACWAQAPESRPTIGDVVEQLYSIQQV